MPQSPEYILSTDTSAGFPPASDGLAWSGVFHPPSCFWCRPFLPRYQNAPARKCRKGWQPENQPASAQSGREAADKAKFSRGRQVSSSSGTEKRNGSTTTIRWQPEVMSPRSSEQNASEASASMEAAAASVLPCAIISPMSLMPPSRKTVLKHCPFQVRCHFRSMRESVKPSTPPLIRENRLSLPSAIYFTYPVPRLSFVKQWSQSVILSPRNKICCAFIIFPAFRCVLFLKYCKIDTFREILPDPFQKSNQMKKGTFIFENSVIQ